MAIDYHAYWDGTSRAVLSRELIAPKWRDKEVSIQFTNSVFAFYYKARNNIANCTNKKQYALMMEHLKDAAEYTGWGNLADSSGKVHNLWQSFQHLAATGYWKDPGTYYYDANSYSPIWTGGLEVVPLGPMRFAYRTNEKFTELAKRIQKHAELAKSLEQKTAEALQSTLSKIQTVAESIAPYLWVIPQGLETPVVSWAEKGMPFLDYVNKFTEFIGKGMTPCAIPGKGASTTLAGLSLAASYVPVLGQFYSEAIKSIPALTEWAQNVTKAKVDLLTPIVGGEAGRIFPNWQGLK
ncbi:MAG: hypothetical protein JNL98_24715 [Bryobacterales bacterium]|nr:hypothetical protein [Bryobacterales bacterium]